MKLQRYDIDNDGMHYPHESGDFYIASEVDARDAASPEPVAWMDVDALAQEIRRVDGSHNLGAGALAEALMPFLSSQAAPVAPTPWQGSEYDRAVAALAPLLEDGHVAQYDHPGKGRMTCWYGLDSCFSPYRNIPHYSEYLECWVVADEVSAHVIEWVKIPNCEDVHTSLRRIQGGRVASPSPALNEGGE